MGAALKSLIASGVFVFGVMSSAFADGQAIEYRVGEKLFSAYLEKSSMPSKGVVFIIHDWDGLGDYEKSRAKMLSDLGFDAVAMDLFGVEAKLDGRDDYRRETGALYRDRGEFRARISAAMEAGKRSGVNSERVVVLGYCFGGAATLEAARAGIEADGFVSFHGGLGTPEGQDYRATTGSVLLLHGTADPVSGMSDLALLLDQLEEADIPHDAEVYGGARHSFTVPGSRDYDARAERKSWAALQRFLAGLN